MTRKAISLILAATLAMALISGCSGGSTGGTGGDTGAKSSKDGARDTLTRAEWVQKLTATMGYDKASGNNGGNNGDSNGDSNSNSNGDSSNDSNSDSNNADAHFSDVKADHHAYDSVQTAAAYSLIDYGAGTFSPDEPATREFVAATAAKAVGFVGAPNAIMGDISGLRDAEHIQLAVDSGLIDCPDGAFNPNGKVTATEGDVILGRITAMTTITVDPSHVDTVTHSPGVVDLSTPSAEVIYNDPKAMSIQLSEADASALEIGTVYLLPPSAEYPYGVARKARAINQGADGTYTIENEEPTIDEVFAEIDIQGTYFPDFSNIIWADGITGEVAPNGDQGLSSHAGGIEAQPLSYTSQQFSSKSVELSISAEGEIGDCEYSFTLDIHELKATAFVTKRFIFPVSAGVLIEESHSLSLGATLSSFEGEIPLAIVPIPLGPTGISIMVEITLSIEGEVTFTIKNEVKSEIWIDVHDSGTATNGKIIDSRWSYEIEASVEAGPKFAVSLSLIGLDLVEVSVFIGIGAKGVTNGECFDLTVYMPFYIEPALLPQLEDIIDLSRKIDIWTADNSPLRKNWHYENGVPVPRCTRGDIFEDAGLSATPMPPGETPATLSPVTDGVIEVIQFGGFDWIVLDRQDGKALIITEGVIARMTYQENIYLGITWGTSDIRAYLNGDFYNRFSEADRGRIADTNVVNDDNPWYGTPGGDDTIDKIFLLSLDEVVRYFGDSGQLADRPYSLSSRGSLIYDRDIDDQYNEARIDRDGYFSGWWLRSLGDNDYKAAVVRRDGTISVSGHPAGTSAADHSDTVGIRPALWLILE